MAVSLIHECSPPNADSVEGECDGRSADFRQRVVVNLLLAVGIVVLLTWGRLAVGDLERHPEESQTRATAIPTALDFDVVQQQFRQVSVMMTADEVSRLLGPQRYAMLHEPAMDEYEERVSARPDRYPEPRYWAKWDDPKQPARWVAVFICGGRVYKTLKAGE